MKYKNRIDNYSPLLFSQWLESRSCLLCPSFPVCHKLSYKEIAIINLFIEILAVKKKRFFTLNEFHSEFLKYFIFDRDGYTTFYNIMNNLTNSEGILLKINGLNSSDSLVREIQKENYQETDILFALNPAYSFNFPNPSMINHFCPIGMLPECYQIIEIVSHSNGMTVNQIMNILNKNNSKSNNLHRQTIRRRLIEMKFLNLLLVKTPLVNNEPIKYIANPAHFLINQS